MVYISSLITAVYNPQWGPWAGWEECLARQCGLQGVRKRKRICLDSVSPEDCKTGYDTDLETCVKYCTGIMM